MELRQIALVDLPGGLFYHPVQSAPVVPATAEVSTSQELPTGIVTMSRDLATINSDEAYALHPDLLLGPDGVQHDAILIIEGGKIVAIEPSSRGQSVIASDIDIVRLDGCAVIPGFIDAHHHVGASFAKSVTFGEPAQMWKHIWMPLDASATPESTYIAAKWTFLEALRGGFTTIVDHGIRAKEATAAVHQAAEDVGVRLVSSTGVYDIADFDTAAEIPNASSTIDAAIRVAEHHVEATSTRKNIIPSIACGNVQSASGEMIGAMAQFCAENDILFQIHANEHTPEVHRCIEREGKRPIEYLFDVNALGRTTLIAHATLVTSEEIKLLRDTDTAVAYNPVASQWKGNGIAPALEYARQGIRFGLGTDATRNDAFRLLDAAESTQRLKFGLANDDFSCGAGWLWIDAGTRGGAEAVGLGETTGCLAPGYQADLLILDMTMPEVIPSWDFTWELVRYYDRANIVATIVAAEPVMVNGEPTRFDRKEFVEKHLLAGRQSVLDAKIVRLHGPSDEYRSAGRSKRSSFHTIRR